MFRIVCRTELLNVITSFLFPEFPFPCNVLIFIHLFILFHYMLMPGLNLISDKSLLPFFFAQNLILPEENSKRQVVTNNKVRKDVYVPFWSESASSEWNRLAMRQSSYLRNLRSNDGSAVGWNPTGNEPPVKNSDEWTRAPVTWLTSDGSNWNALTASSIKRHSSVDRFIAFCSPAYGWIFKVRYILLFLYHARFDTFWHCFHNKPE